MGYNRYQNCIASHSEVDCVSVCACVCAINIITKKKSELSAQRKKKKKNLQDLDSGEGGEMLETAKSLLDFLGFFG